MEPATVETIKLVVGSGGLIALGIGMAMLIFRTGKIVQKINSMDERDVSMNAEIKEIKNTIGNINAKLSHLEGAFAERGYWQSRNTGTHGKPR